MIGRARSGETQMVYALFDLGAEKILLRYEGPADAVAFNRSAAPWRPHATDDSGDRGHEGGPDGMGVRARTDQSLESVSAEPLLMSEVTRALPVDGARWESRPLPAPSAPSIITPARFGVEISAPFACQGLPPVESALAASPEGDFTVSLRVGWWADLLDSVTSTSSLCRALPSAAAACSQQTGGFGDASYFYTFDWLGVRYVVEGVFIADTRGTLQLEVVAPESKRKTYAITRARVGAHMD